MVRLLIYGYTTGVRSSRAIERRCVDDVPFRWLASGAAPDYRSIARFRKRHLSALAQLFLQALKLCQAAGMVSLGRVALDGTKVRANASKRKAMSYARLTDKEKVLAEEISALLAEAQRIDDAEDAKFGKDRRGDELPAELARRESGWPSCVRPSRRWRSRPVRRLRSTPPSWRGARAPTRAPSPNGPPQLPRRRRPSPRRNGTSPTRTAESC